ncbi:hypothetical protein F4678DRAFT_458870 [Xylaria arbuscula]|nr:hypothetical protein F4678DRAFT_458870 [Xylaria arbuscula]
MARQRMILDPNGDLLVILRNPSRITEPSEAGEPIGRDSSQVIEPEPLQLETSDLETTTVADSDSGNEIILTPLDDDYEHDWVFKTSSKHLALSSTYFKRMLNGPWYEATEIHEDGLKHWVVEDFDPTAMEIILNIIHLRNRTVPHTLDEVDTLVEIARIVDYLQCHEAMEYYASLWIEDLEYRYQTPGGYDIELLRWICIVGVFHQNTLFKQCTRVAITGNHFGIATLGLPILAQISNMTNQRRMDHLDEIFASVYSLMDSLAQDTICSFECDALRLGILTKHLKTEFLTLRPKRPYPRMSIDEVLDVLSRLSALVDWSKSDGHSRCGFIDL